MATGEKRQPMAEAPPNDLVAVIRRSGILSDRQVEDLKNRVLKGDYPFEAKALAERLIDEDVLTEYQASRFLRNKAHGLVVGKYVILDRIGSGSMGRVYKAHHQLMGRVVAIKIIAPEISNNERVVSRFQREMKLVGRLDHPNVVRAFDADQIGSVLYIVMEYVSGQSLSIKLRTDGPLNPADAVDYIAQSARGLAHAHDQGIVHRDVKPSNLYLSKQRNIKVLDLGLGVLMEADQHCTFETADGVAVGTVDYMSPEQACGQEVDGRSDVYSLGCAMYHLVTGRLPFQGDSPIERLGKRISNPPVPILSVRPDLPSNVVKVMDKMLAIKPRDRFQSAREAADALELLIRRKAPVSLGPGDASVNVKPKVSGGDANVQADPIAALQFAAGGSSQAPGPVQAAPPPRVIIRDPVYPRWFRPQARLVEQSPWLGLAAAITISIALLGLGFLLGKLL